MTSYQEDGQTIGIDLRRTDQLLEMPDLSIANAIGLFLTMSDQKKGQRRVEAFLRLSRSEQSRYENSLRTNEERKLTEEEIAEIARKDAKYWKLTTVSSHTDGVSYGEGVGHYECPQCGSYSSLMWIQEDEPCSNIGCVDCGTALHEAIKNRRTVGQFLALILK